MQYCKGIPVVKISDIHEKAVAVIKTIWISLNPLLVNKEIT